MKISLKKATALLCLPMALGSAFNALAADGVKVEQLGVNNTLVRVEGNGRYLMLPVQEAYDDATVNVVVDGKLDRTIFVRLAKSKVDYTMPLDLAPYKGHDVVLNIITSHDRSNVREAQDDACWSNFSLTDTLDTANKEKYRPMFHHTPLYGWMNDPNGMFYKDGVWHLYYQWNPYGSKWQNMTWGHSSSPDLVNWTHHPAAIEPNGLGAVFSGSSALDTENSTGFGKNGVVAMYTSAGASQTQSLAWSADNGETFNIYPGNPVITLDSEARDPNMFWNPRTKQWNLVLAHALDHEMLFFTSPDMKEWTLQSSFGKGEGAQGGVWECPDLFELPLGNTGTTKWVLICNINPGGPFGGSAVQYFIGDFDGKTFKADTDASGKIPTKWLDHGKDNYALVSWSNAPEGRRTAIGWMSNWQYAAEVPTHQFRSANTLPREISLFTAPDGQIYAASTPSPELEKLRANLALSTRATAGTSPKNYSLPTANNGICEIIAEVDAPKASTVTLTFANKAGENVTLTYRPGENTLEFDRRKSGIVDFSNEFPAVTTAPTFSKDGKLSLRIFVDTSSMEVFANNGRSVMTNLVFPTTPYTTLSVNATGGQAKIKDLKIYSLSATK
ncbi:MAG: GH32 C-terminal domain-containing protein [Firmicutes bacterium]|nr:GH32 C-terminal domain-containing protein [Bacillota bacterium]MCM1400601.1 GH32 C-terminal domain-containing protein [Bacteroides sp.]MCM1476312.1 GH32 C-terminal domain-containing protein [Bacteroides sp.]